MVYNFQTRNNEMLLFTEYESVTPKSFIWEHCTRRIHVQEKICHASKWRLQEDAMCTLWYFETMSVIKTQHHYSTQKNGVFWVVTQCGSCKNRRFGGTWRLLHQGDKNR
jgi:hypothetical protein